MEESRLETNKHATARIHERLDGRRLNSLLSNHQMDFHMKVRSELAVVISEALAAEKIAMK